MKLTDEQLGRLPTWFSRIWNKNREGDRLCPPQYTSFDQFTVDGLISELAHALEQVAAAKLMAEALGDARRRGRDFQAYAAGVYTKVEFEQLVFQRQVALAAWKALETTQDGESGGA